MSNVIVSLSPDYLLAIIDAAEILADAEMLKSRKEWLIGTTANEHWDECEKYYKDAGINNEYFNILTSKAINEAAGFPLISESGDTLRMWREVTEQFKNVKEDLKKLPFDYFRKARTLWNKSEHGETLIRITAPVVPIAEAIANNWTAREMYDNYIDPVAMVKNISKREKWTPEKWQEFSKAFDEFMKGWME
jgi:hypothetical protein